MAKTLRIGKGRAGAETRENTNLDTVARDASQVGMSVVLTLAALIGIWGFACLIGGIANSASVADLVHGFITAVTGH